MYHIRVVGGGARLLADSAFHRCSEMESELMSLLDEVRSLSKSQQIRVAAIMGALIADAAGNKSMIMI